MFSGHCFGLLLSAPAMRHHLNNIDRLSCYVARLCWFVPAISPTMMVVVWVSVMRRPSRGFAFRP
jgi:hypothetical protein